MPENLREVGNKVFFEKESNFIQPKKNNAIKWAIGVGIISLLISTIALTGNIPLNSTIFLLLGACSLIFYIAIFRIFKNVKQKNTAQWTINSHNKTISVGERTVRFDEITEIYAGEKKSRTSDQKKYELLLILNDRKLTLTDADSLEEINNVKEFISLIINLK